MNINSKGKAIHNILFKLLEKISARKDMNITVDGGNSSDIVDTTHYLHYGFLSVFNINTGEDELEKIKDTGNHSDCC